MGLPWLSDMVRLTESVPSITEPVDRTGPDGPLPTPVAPYRQEVGRF